MNHDLLNLPNSIFTNVIFTYLSLNDVNTNIKNVCFQFSINSFQLLPKLKLLQDTFNQTIKNNINVNCILNTSNIHISSSNYSLNTILNDYKVFLNKKTPIEKCLLK